MFALGVSITGEVLGRGLPGPASSEQSWVRLGFPVVGLVVVVGIVGV
jgi:hypothetical protein